eukprot:m.168915 g.168915  ORF g.168915 m.168915 type:complete len:71 (+) comp14761_c0_seq1:583-795(+)
MEAAAHTTPSLCEQSSVWPDELGGHPQGFVLAVIVRHDLRGGHVVVEGLDFAVALRCAPVVGSHRSPVSE